MGEGFLQFFKFGFFVESCSYVVSKGAKSFIVTVQNAREFVEEWVNRESEEGSGKGATLEAPYWYLYGSFGARVALCAVCCLLFPWHLPRPCERSHPSNNEPKLS